MFCFIFPNRNEWHPLMGESQHKRLSAEFSDCPLVTSAIETSLLLSASFCFFICTNSSWALTTQFYACPLKVRAKLHDMPNVPGHGYRSQVQGWTGLAVGCTSGEFTLKRADWLTAEREPYKGERRSFQFLFHSTFTSRKESRSATFACLLWLHVH